ncbi:MAG: ATP-binding protein [Mycoplasmataceae bacterium]|nr:ATP-binding protein [Mycoplasmataceae bacterium]
MELVRQKYLDRILKWKDKHVIKIITGVRRSGKSHILNQYKEVLQHQQHVTSKQIIDYDFSDEKFANLDRTSLHKAILGRAIKNKINYVILDEIQEIKEFERVVISLFENKSYKFDIYLTGSNSKLFSASLATLFTGRNIEIKIYPFSLSEYVDWMKLNNAKHIDKYESFEKYVLLGGMPIILELNDDKELIKERLLKVVDDTLEEDIKRRHKIYGFDEFKKFTEYVMKHNGTIFSTLNISNYLKSNNRTKTSHITISKYLSYLCESLLIYKLNFYNTKSKAILDVSSKYYSVDTGLKNVFNDFGIEDYGRLLENIVFIELLRRGFSVYVAKLRGNKEVDFVAKKEKELIYIQVADRLSTEAIKEREYGNLNRLRDNYKKIVITRDRLNFINDKGIETINIVDWLLE